MAKNPRQLWKFVPIDRYSRPVEPATEAVRKGILGVWDRLRKHPPPEKSFIAKEDLLQVPDELLQQAVAPPVWDPAVSALSTTLERWLQTPEPATSVQVLVGPPFGGVSEITTHWAHAHEWRLVRPPPTAQVLTGGDDWFNELASDASTPLVIPSLEDCYVRHHDGLALMRHVIDWLCTNRPCCLLGCSSWAWAYFRKVFEVDVVFPPPLTLQGFDNERLQQWFRSLASGTESADFMFLQANNGKLVLAREARCEQPEGYEKGRRKSTNDRSSGVSNFLQHVAGCSRGNPGVAWSIWRHSLQLAADEAARKTEAQNSARVLLVKPWPEIDLPFCSSQPSQNDLLVLHALLLHNGLPTDLLPQVLPCNITEIMHSLHELYACGMLEQTHEGWHVTALGYPAARRLLAGEDYLCDQF